MWCLETIKSLNEAAFNRFEKNEKVTLAFSDVKINSGSSKKKTETKSLNDLVCMTRCKDQSF